MQWRAIVLASITPSYFLNSAILGFEPRGFGTYGSGASHFRAASRSPSRFNNFSTVSLGASFWLTRSDGPKSHEQEYPRRLVC